MTEPEPFAFPRRRERAADDDGEADRAGEAERPDAVPPSVDEAGRAEARAAEMARDLNAPERPSSPPPRRTSDWYFSSMAAPGDDAGGRPTAAGTAVHAPDVEPPSAEDGGDDEPAGRRSTSSSLLRELPILILIAFVLAFLLRTFVVQVFYIPSSSMEPTLQVDDRILVDKVTYRFRDLDRGEIVVFEGDQSPVVRDEGPVESVLRSVGQLVGVTPVSARDFVKRVVGLPGDELYIDEDGNVFVNGEELEEDYLGQRDPRTCGPLTVPDGKLFFLGDNRANSSDSRASLGFVPVDHVVGRAFLTLWPLDRVHLLDRPAYPGVPDPVGVPPAGEVPDGDVCDP